MTRGFTASACFAAALATAFPVRADLSVATNAINALGIELLAREPRNGNALLSSYSIQIALAMTYAGAAGKTRDEMKATLHYAGDDAKVHESFVGLQAALAAITGETAAEIKESSSGIGYFRAEKSDSAGTPLTFVTANRLFGQDGFEFRSPFLEFLDEQYQAPLQRMDFVHRPNESREKINDWVANRTKQRIIDLIPSDGIDKATRLVLVNAIYLKASWAGGFPQAATKPRPFTLATGETVDVPTMQRGGYFGYAKQEGYTVVHVPYTGEKIHLLILLPDDPGGLPGLESKLTPDLLRSVAFPQEQYVILYLPRFKIEPPLMALSRALKEFGMRTAFDDPKGSADFSQMAPRNGDDYLCLSEAYHKTFLTLDERGTEAAAATALGIRLTGMPPSSPPELKIDRPFLFAIQHRASGACLFLGRVNDPRSQ